MIKSFHGQIPTSNGYCIVDWSLKKLNILTGPNGSGKTLLLKLIEYEKDCLLLSSQNSYKFNQDDGVAHSWFIELTGKDLRDTPNPYWSNGDRYLFDLLAMLTPKQKIMKLHKTILIDDLGHNLHITIQKELLTFIVNKLPNKQFIITTHSPAIVNGRWDNVTEISTILTPKQ